MLVRLIVLISCFSLPVAWGTENAQLTTLLDEIWQYDLDHSPQRATSLGEKNASDQLEDLSPQALKIKNAKYQAFTKKLHAIDASRLSRQEQITLGIQLRNLKNKIDQYHYKAHYMPLTSEYGFHNRLASIATATSFQTLTDYQNYLRRLQQFPRYFEQQISWMKKGIEEDITQPQSVMKGFEDSIQAFITDQPENSPFYAPFKSVTLDAVSADDIASLQQQASEIIRTQVIPSYQGFFNFFTQTYLPATKTDIAISSIPNGKDYYQNRAEFYTTTTLSAEDIHNIGLKEVARIREDMHQVMKELEYEGDLAQFIQFLRTDPRFYAKSSEELLKQASYLSKQIDAKLPQLFYTLPRTPYGVAPVPDSIAPKYTTGRYIASTGDDKPGYYWVNTYALDKRPLYALPALTLHEAVPGHHLQISLSREMQDLPPVRRYNYISAFGEGWGLYSEYLGKEVGMYATPYDEFGRLSYEMWRACRLVVDTGMHIKGWSRQKAIDYMLKNTALSEHNIRTEVDRYISWPAQALSYKIGELTIKKLRQQVKQQLGPQFDLRAFHDELLKFGSVPLDVLEQNMQNFVNKQLSAQN